MNSYFKFTARVKVPTAGASIPTNCWYGAARVHTTALVMTDAVPGDELHQLVGGTFLVKKKGGACFEVKRQVVDALGESTPTTFPWSAVQPIEQSVAMRVARYRREARKAVARG